MCCRCMRHMAGVVMLWTPSNRSLVPLEFVELDLLVVGDHRVGFPEDDVLAAVYMYVHGLRTCIQVHGHSMYYYM